MAQQTNILKITLDGTGTEIPALNISTGYDSYLITGPVIPPTTATGNYAIVPTGVPQLGDKFVFEYNGTLDITTNGNTFSLFGQSITQAQLLKYWTAVCLYNGSSWDVSLELSLADSDVISSSNIGTGTIVNSNIANNTIDGSTKLVNLSVTTAKINDLAVTTTKIDNLAVTDGKIANVNGSKLVGASVTNDRLAVMANNTVKGNVSGGSATPLDIPISTIIGGNTWGLTGNAGTTAGTNFIGTTDAVSLVFKVNNTQAGKIDLGFLNTSFGINSLISNTTGTNSAAFGLNSLQNNISGGGNSAFGAGSLANITISSANTGLGYAAGDTIVTGSNNTCIGYSSDVTNAAALNRIALGYNAQADTDYQFALPDNVDYFKFRGNSFELPSSDGAANAVLQTDGSGVLSFGLALNAGIYTPTLTNVTNVTASTAYICQWMQIGNVVTVSGKVDIDPTAAAATPTELGMSLPVSSNFSAEEECGGTAVSDVASTYPVRILADSVNNRASFKFLSGTTTSDSYSFTFTYQII